MKKFAVIGQPVAHSRSPDIHQHFAAAQGIELEYLKIEADAEGFAAAVRDFIATGGQGLNVTVPFKQAAFELADSRSDAATLAGTVNTLSFEDGKVRGDNTDGIGLLRDLQRLGISLRSQRVLVIGAGGAARGILGPLLGSGPEELVWSSRSPWIIQELEPKFAEHGSIRACTNLALKGDRFTLLINATSAGHSGQIPRLPDGLLAPDAVAYDLSYGPAAEPFLAWARQQGAANTHDGLGMLVEQAAVSFEIWHGVQPDSAPVIAALRKV